MLAIRAAPIFALALAGALALAAPASADATADLFAATKGGTASEVGAALSAGANPGARDENNNTPLHLAAMHNPAASVIVTLIEGGADPGARNEGGATPLHGAAALNPAASVITALIEGGADPDARNEFGFTFTASHATAEENLAASVMVSMIGAMFAVTPLHMAVWHNENPSVITALIEGGADPGARDEWGKTPFDYAEDNEALRGTDAYWRLNDGRFE